MSRSFKALLSAIDGFRYRRQIEGALALNLRGEVREDGLALHKVLSRLEVEWYARDIHPWDRDRGLSSEEKDYIFVQQCLSDTEAVISRLFERLPQMDIVEVRVLEPRSKMPIVGGTVSRSDFERDESLSVGMRLVLSGVTFRLSGWCFDALGATADQHLCAADDQHLEDHVNRMQEVHAAGL